MKEDGFQLYAVEKGCGQPMVFLHGNGEDSTYFDSQIKFFSKRYWTIAVDTRGHGKTERGQAPFNLIQFAEDLKQFLDSRQLKHIILLGFSDGGNIALIFTLKYPEYVDRLILNGANLYPSGMKLNASIPIFKEYLKTLTGKDKETTKDKRQLLELMVKEPHIKPEHLRRIQIPVLVIAGTRDMIKKSHTKKIFDNLPNGYLCIVEGTHFIAKENPDKFNRYVLKFLEGSGKKKSQTEQIPGWRQKMLSRKPEWTEKYLYREAAVLVPLVQKDGEWQVLFQVRSKSLKDQPGDICFPGGSIKDLETPLEAAARETVEELLIREEQIEITGTGDIVTTPAGRMVHSFLAELKDYNNTFSPDEVEEVFYVPLSWFMEHEPKGYMAAVDTRPEENDFPWDQVSQGKNHLWGSGKYEIFFYNYQGRVIWGITAKIMKTWVALLREPYETRDSRE